MHRLAILFCQQAAIMSSILSMLHWSLSIHVLLPTLQCRPLPGSMTPAKRASPNRNSYPRLQAQTQALGQ